MDDVDRRIIARLQTGLPDSVTPYADAARELNISADELVERLSSMRKSGVVRSIRAVLDQRKVGFAGNVLVAWQVDKSRADEVGRQFGKWDEVSHCVLRNAVGDGWSYNLYTMIHADTMERCREIVEEMTLASGIRDRAILETVRELKKTAPRYFS